MNYLPQECQQLQLISDACGGLRLRISRLWDSDKLETPAEAVLKYLGELKRPYLTAFEERLLRFMEQECKIVD